MDENYTVTINALAQAVIAEMRSNPGFRAEICGILESFGKGGAAIAAPYVAPAGRDAKPQSRTGRKNRREPAALNPLELAAKDLTLLERELEPLTDKQLKDIIAEYGLDPSRLSMKWRKKEKLIAKILEEAPVRASKGDAFRG